MLQAEMYCSSEIPYMTENIKTLVMCAVKTGQYDDKLSAYISQDPAFHTVDLSQYIQQYIQNFL